MLDEPGHHNDLHTRGAARRKDRGAKSGRCRGILVAHNTTRDVRLGRVPQTTGIRSAGDDQADVDVQLSGRNLVKDIAQGAAATRDEHGNR
jgi:hypothetical protein